jgi:uncharacterized SAM-binding protein YcdF (DUF218 family)
MLGGMIGALVGLVVAELSFIAESSGLMLLAFIVAGMLLSLTRWRKVVWAAGVIVTIGLLIVSVTPVVPWLVSQPSQEDLLEPTEAVVALGAGVRLDDSLAANSQDRILRAFVVLKAGNAREMVVPVAGKSRAPIVRRQMTALGLSYPIDEPGPVATTHDEAVVVSRLARERGWGRVILVTNGWHMARAAATFEKAGVHVLRAPCPDSRTDMIHPTGVSERLRALSCWLHEWVGIRVYRWRGWI